MAHRAKDPLVAGGGRKKRLEGYNEAKERGIVDYRVIKPKPGRYIRVAIVRERGPRGGRTVATSLIRKKEK